MAQQGGGTRVRRAVIVGSGPNGLTAAAVLARAGWDVAVFEKNATVGGAARSNASLGEGTIVDTGASAHPFGVASPIFRELELERYGVQWLYAPYPLAHPLPGQAAALLHRSLDATAAELGADARAWQRIHGPVTRHIDAHLANILGPLPRWPRHPLHLAAFAPTALPSAEFLARRAFTGEAAQALFLGSAAHAIAPLNSLFTGAFGTLFGALGQSRGWPVARGGTQSIVDALVSVITEHGGRLYTNTEVTQRRSLPAADALLLNVTPRQAIRILGPDRLHADAGMTARTSRRLARWRHGVAVWKIDYRLGGPVPWRDERVAQATTVHVVGSPEELVRAEAQAAAGILPSRPFVLLSQQQAADPSRATGAAAGAHIISAYAHVPHGYEQRGDTEVAGLIEAQIERFAPGFRDLILDRDEFSPTRLESDNPNLVGGDIAGGAMTGLQSLLRPGLTLDPYRLSVGRSARVYLCSAATPPGAGVHGMAGAWAARAALADDARLSQGDV